MGFTVNRESGAGLLLREAFFLRDFGTDFRMDFGIEYGLAGIR